MRRSRRALLCSVLTPALAVVGVFAGPVATASAATGLTWSQASEIEAPENASGNLQFELNGVACPAVGSCVGSVGSYEALLLDGGWIARLSEP